MCHPKENSHAQIMVQLSPFFQLTLHTAFFATRVWSSTLLYYKIARAPILPPGVRVISHSKRFQNLPRMTSQMGVSIPDACWIDQPPGCYSPLGRLEEPVGVWHLISALGRLQVDIQESSWVFNHVIWSPLKYFQVRHLGSPCPKNSRITQATSS